MAKTIVPKTLFFLLALALALALALELPACATGDTIDVGPVFFPNGRDLSGIPDGIYLVKLDNGREELLMVKRGELCGFAALAPEQIKRLVGHIPTEFRLIDRR